MSEEVGDSFAEVAMFLLEDEDRGIEASGSHRVWRRISMKGTKKPEL